MEIPDYMPDDLEGEAPCEFCGELFPLVLLIEHQSIHMTGGDDYAYIEDILNQEEAQNFIVRSTNDATEPQVNVELNQKSADTNQIKTVEDNANIVQNSPKRKITEESAKTEEKKQSSSEAKASTVNVSIEQKQSLLFTETLKNTKKFTEQKGKEFITEKGEKLLVYGDEIDPDKELENEKPAYKVPNNPLFDSVSKNDVEDINNLSDDDCDESLEEFWKRARDFLKRNRVKNES